MRERSWDVYYGHAASPIRVSATSAADAVNQAMQEVEAESYYPHRAGCGCRTSQQACFIARAEAKLRGTPLGKLCRL